MGGRFPGPMFALSAGDDGEHATRLVRVHSGGNKYVALFTTGQRANAWAAANAPDQAIAPVTFGTADAFVAFLVALLSGGETHVAVDPPADLAFPAVAGLAPVDQLVRLVRGS